MLHSACNFPLILLPFLRVVTLNLNSHKIFNSCKSCSMAHVQRKYWKLEENVRKLYHLYAISGVEIHTFGL